MASSEFDWSPGAPYDAALIKTLAPPPPLYFPTLPTPRSIKAAANDGRRIANLFLRSCLTVKTTRTLDQLSQRVRDNASLAKSQGAAALLEALRAHDKECDDILGKGFVNPFSTLYIDRQGVRILAYLAYPHPDGKGEEEHILLRTFLQGGHIYSTQYFEGLGESSDLDYQGLPLQMGRAWWIAAQGYASKILPEGMRGESKRHRVDVSLQRSHYSLLGRGNSGEYCGVYHILHCRHQQGKLQTAMTPSRTTKSYSVQTSMKSRNFHSLTADVCAFIGGIFEILWPEQHAVAAADFAAGQWYAEDPGPYLGHVVGYKLQTTSHADTGDLVPTVTFPVGLFKDGHMDILELRARLRYGPRDIVAGWTSRLTHRVTPWTALSTGKASPTERQFMDKHKLTPGRIFSVSFLKNDVHDTLVGKPEKWGLNTLYGLHGST